MNIIYTPISLFFKEIKAGIFIIKQGI